jgi:fumarate hydratase class II
MPPGVIKAFGILKGAAATVNMKYGLGKDEFVHQVSIVMLIYRARPQDWRGNSASCC